MYRSWMKKRREIKNASRASIRPRDRFTNQLREYIYVYRRGSAIFPQTGGFHLYAEDSIKKVRVLFLFIFVLSLFFIFYFLVSNKKEEFIASRFLKAASLARLQLRHTRFGASIGKSIPCALSPLFLSLSLSRSALRPSKHVIHAKDATTP